MATQSIYKPGDPPPTGYFQWHDWAAVQDKAGRMHGHHGYTHEMTNDEHRSLAGVLNTLKGMVIVSGYHSPLYDDLYTGWHRIERKALADGAKERIEILWMNFSPPQKMLSIGV